MPPAEQLTIDEALAKAKKAVKLGRNAVAAELYGAVLRQQPNHPVAKKGLRKLQHGRSTRSRIAEPAQERINELVALLQAGQIEKAGQISRAMLSEFPKSLVVMNVLGIALQRLGKLSEAVGIFDKAIELKPDVVETWINRGIALKELGRVDDAVASYDKAIELKPDHAEVHFNRANLLKDIGDLDKAVSAYERAITIRPGFADAHRNLSAVKTYQPNDTQIGAMESLMKVAETTANDRMQLGFALAKAYEDLRQFDTSFEYLLEANRLRKEELRYDLEEDQTLFAAIKNVFAGQTQVQPDAGETNAAKEPVFIVGMMRSGTSLVEQILASHSGVHGAGELETLNRLLATMPDKAPADIRHLRAAYLDALDVLDVPETIVTDKMPLNFRWIGFIVSAFPGARIIHVKRDPIATCFSIFKNYFPDDGNAYAYDMADLAEYYKLYSDLMSFWHQLYPDNIYDLDYERLTENHEEETRKLLAFCDLGWEDRCLEFYKTSRMVKTTSAAQVRKRIYKGSSEAWKNYRHHLEPLITGLGNIRG